MDETSQPAAESADSVFKHWEWLRLFYNGVLALGLIPLGNKLISNLNLAEFVIWCVIVANVAFCAGHALEGYASLIGIPRKIARYGVFVLVTICAVGVEQTMIGLEQVSHHPE